MKLVSYFKESHEQLALLMGDTLYNMDALHPELPSTMGMFLNYWEDYYPLAKAVNESIEEGKISFNKGIPIESANLVSPVPLPAACLNTFGSTPHNITASFTEPQTGIQHPDLYFTNHHSVQGPGEVNCMPDHFEKLDVEPGIAIVVCAYGRNIAAADADRFIGGFMIKNNISTRSRIISNQLGNPALAKGKDISIVLGPMLVTADELKQFEVPAHEGHTGSSYDLTITCRVNNEQVYQGNMADMKWTFAEILESSSYGADLQPGNVIGNAAIHGGCFFDLNETGRQTNPQHTERWLQAGDVFETAIDVLGISVCTIVAAEQ